MLRKAVEAKLVFSGSDLVEFACINDKELATAAVRNSAERLTAEDMEYLYGEIDDEVLVEICKQRRIQLPEDLREEEYEEDMAEREAEENAALQGAGQPVMAGVQGGGTIIIGGGMPVGTAGAGQAAQAAPSDGEAQDAQGDQSTQTIQNPQSSQPVSAINMPQWVAQQQQVSPEMEEATTRYVDELNKLTDMLAKVSEQSVRLTRDSEEMENLNRTLTGICKVYEMQLKGASAQIGTIDQINEQSRRMAAQIEQLNAIYARMIEAMTVNMRAAAPGAAPQV